MKLKSDLFRWSDPREAVTDLYCITILFLFLLFPGFSGYADITRSKYVFLLAATVLWLLALLVVSVRRKAPLPRLSAAQWAACAFLAVSVVSALCSPYFPDTLIGAGRYDGLLTTAVYCMIFLGVSLFTRPKPIHAYAFAAALTVCCAIAVLQLLGLNPLHLYPGDLRWQDAGIRYSGTYLGTIGNTNLLDAVLALAIPLCFIEAVSAHRFAFAVPLVLSLIIAAAAGGSGLHLSLAAFVLAALVLLPKQKRFRTLGALLAAVLLIAGLLVLWFLPQKDGSAFELSRMLHGHFEDSYGSSRILIWRNCLALIPERPLLGGGPGSLALRLNIVFSRFVPETGETLQSYVDNAHCIYLSYLSNIGVIGLVAYLSLLVCCAVRALQLMRERRIFLFCFLAAFCASVHACFALGLCLTEPYYFLLLAFCSPCRPCHPVEEVIL